MLQKQNDPLTLPSQTDRIQNISIESIPQTEESKPVLLDYFSGTIREFRNHLKFQRIFLNA